MGYTVSAKKLRPLPSNDSQKPLSERCCGALATYFPQNRLSSPTWMQGECNIETCSSLLTVQENWQ